MAIKSWNGLCALQILIFGKTYGKIFGKSLWSEASKWPSDESLKKETFSVYFILLRGASY